jgi:hypothetical protein
MVIQNALIQTYIVGSRPSKIGVTHESFSHDAIGALLHQFVEFAGIRFSHMHVWSICSHVQN